MEFCQKKKKKELRSTWSSAPAPGVHSPPSSRSPNASRIKDGNQSSARLHLPSSAPWKGVGTLSAPDPDLCDGRIAPRIGDQSVVEAPV
ncbi:hypothetical protein GQ55_3G198500 [Panicum hallii var. hallii]|uniref:Uncharacterized protein n=1 Tax=Panicum hallii var. hallii TaxID=1504633 RepID=A0A2T7EBC7_9POAL|nr:hypothetical protein GQ55_3G198500 [Panicum hallii var. hallii]